MFAAIDGFLRYLKIERNASELTIKSYSEDFGSLLDYVRDRVGEVSSPAELQIAQLRGYVAYLHECDYAKTTIARRLASLRSFFRYCQREGLVTSNPAKMLRTPRVGRKLPHFLTIDQITQLLEAPPANETEDEQPQNEVLQFVGGYARESPAPSRDRRADDEGEKQHDAKAINRHALRRPYGVDRNPEQHLAHIHSRLATFRRSVTPATRNPPDRAGS